MFRVKGLEFRMQGLGIQGLGFRIYRLAKGLELKSLGVILGFNWGLG